MQTHTYPHIPALGALAVATGFFDGVHRGHAAVIQRLIQVARANGLPSCVATYHPHPRVVLGKDEGLQLLTCFSEKEQRLATLGVDHLVVIPFTKELAALEAEDFFEQYLIKTLNTKKLVVGFDHNIGRNAAAGFEKIKTLGEAQGIEVRQVQAYVEGKVEVSSTKIRKALNEGNIAAANALLGYDYSMHGKVVSGSQIGRKINFPTANIQPECSLKMLPKSGAYAVRVALDGKRHGGMLNIGTRPTVSSGEKHNAEVHIFNFSENIYDREITLTFVERLRDERKMRSLEELQRQLKDDEAKARQVLDLRMMT
jgi:riboflavin kinase/FMN adenylyltransferase